MNPIKKLQTILKEMETHKSQYVAEPQKDFSRNRKVSFYDMMWFLLFIGANSISEEIRRSFNHKDFSYISEAAILKSRNKIKISALSNFYVNSMTHLKIRKNTEATGCWLWTARISALYIVLKANMSR